MVSNEEDLNRLAIQAQLLQRQGQALQEQLDMMQTNITDLNATIDTLDNLSKAAKVGMLPIGSGAYITCQKVDTENVLISVGAGMIVTKKASDAADIMRKRLKTVGDAFDRSQKNLVNINQQLQDLNAKASLLASRMEDVRPTEG
ncbi:MAG: prefoldin subunit alpha [Candidatus Micrarchaeota archaeon]|nr:prefoldin subunit alpha [Candidatus Micrarchaeota archaeon]